MRGILFNEQVVLQFPKQFWDEGDDYFGAALDGGAVSRGYCTTFWNVSRWTGGAPILMALVTGASADQACTAHLQVFPKAFLKGWQ